MKAIELIRAERVQQELRGFDESHDATHDEGQILTAAFCYLGDLVNGPHKEPSKLWPFEDGAWKPTPGDRIRQMVKAGALVAAEIDRVLRWEEREARAKLKEGE